MPEVEDRDQVYRDFHQAVNMAPAELEHWLGSEESRGAGWKADGAGESIAHASAATSSPFCVPRRRISTTGTMRICAR